MGALSEDDWLKRSTAEAIAAARKVVLGDQTVIPMMTPVGRLSDIEWGWLVAAIIFAWIKVRSEQATAEGHNFDDAAVGAAHANAWDAGAIASILPQLADHQAVDWSKPLINWPRDDMLKFLSAAFTLIRAATAARDAGAKATSSNSAALDDPVPC